MWGLSDNPLWNVTVSATSMQSEGGQRRRWFRAGQFDMFRYYRQGEYWPFGDRWGAEYSNPELPLKGIPQVEMPGQRQRLLGYYRDERPNLDIDKLGEDDVDESQIEAWETIEFLKLYFKVPGVSIRYNRCLGWGGQGLVVLFDELAPTGEVARKVVVKSHFPDRNPRRMEEERRNMRIVSKAEHVVQILYAEGFGLNPDEKADMDVDDDDSDRPPLSVLVMEMVENGDLAEFLTKVDEHQEMVPNTVMWRFLLCLVRMCIAMAYPPAKMPENASKPGPITETVPPQLQDQPGRLVHFDFDPFNIFLGGVANNSEHNITPALKLGDWGASVEVESDQNDLYYEHLRMRGKLGFFAPEQFCTDWDYIPPDSNVISKHQIAGNYGAHTNVWGIGLVAETLITLARPALPPQPTETSFNRPPGKDSYHTYAWHLTDEDDYGHLDPDIRGLILRMQAHLPEDRPKLHELEQYVLGQAAAKVYPNESPEQVRRWLDKILFEPPATAKPQPQPPAPAPLPTGSLLEPPVGMVRPGPIRNIPTPVFWEQGNQVSPWGPKPATAPAPRPPQAPGQTIIPGEETKTKTDGSGEGWRDARYHPYGVPPGKK